MKDFKKVISLCLVITLVFSQIVFSSYTAYGETGGTEATLNYIDLNNWNGAGAGNWSVESGGREVSQSINGAVTFFIGDEEVINEVVMGTIKVSSPPPEDGFYDDDMVGFVLGYQDVENSNYDFILFDWKKGNQNGAYEGYSLCRATGYYSSADLGNDSGYFWFHQEEPGKFEIIDTAYKNDNAAYNGWQFDEEYLFKILYTEDRIKVTVDDQEIFNVSGSFKSGKVGFYNYSQAYVTYGRVKSAPGSNTQAPPIAQSDEYAVEKNTTLDVNRYDGILANDYDPNLDNFIITRDTDVSNGNLSLNQDGSFTYTPGSDFSGTDFFTYHLNDDFGQSEEATVNIHVMEANVGPTDISLSSHTVESASANGTIVGTLSTTDGNTDDSHDYMLTNNAGGMFKVVDNTIIVNDNSLLYPGDYDITVRSTDLQGLFCDKTFTITVQPTIFTLTYETNGYGNIIGNANQAVEHRGNGSTVNAMPDEGYHFVNWSDDVETASRTDGNIMGDISATAIFAINEYALTYTPGEHGSLTGNTSQTVNHGTSGSTVTAIPETGYHFVKWSDDVETASRTDGNVIGNINETAIFAINEYTLTYTAGEHGSVTGDRNQLVNHGTNGSTVTAVPDEGYHFLKWSDDVVTASRTDGNVIGNINETAIFSINEYALTYTAGEHGSITGDRNQLVNHGTNGLTVTAVPDEGYHFVKWSDDLETASRTDVNIMGDISETAIFAINEYALTYTAGEHGSLTGNTSQTVNHGTSGSTVTAVPDAGYHFLIWSDDVVTASRTDSNVMGNTSATASFAINEYALTYASGANGSLTGDTSQTVNYGTSGSTVTAVPNTGYHFEKWSDDILTASRTDASITENINVTAIFAINEYALTYTSGAHGSLTGNADQSVNHGANGSTVTAVPDPGYHFVKWSDDVVTASRTDSNVMGNTNVTAIFALNAPTIYSVVAGNSYIDISWNPVPNAEGYLIYQRTDSSDYDLPIAMVDNLTLSNYVNGLINGTTYYFAIKTFIGSEESIFSDEVSVIPMTKPQAPSHVSALPGIGEVTITFDAPQDDGGSQILGYTVISHPDNIVITRTDTAITEVRTNVAITMTGLTNGTNYTFTVKALNSEGESEESIPSNGVIPYASFRPMIQQVSEGNRSVHIEWTEVPGSTGYTLYQRTETRTYSAIEDVRTGSAIDDVRTYSAIIDVRTDTAITIDELTNGTTYFFTVTATNPGGETDHSNEVSATPKAVPAAPTNVTARGGNGKAIVTFSVPLDDGGSPITGYVVRSAPGDITVVRTDAAITDVRTDASITVTGLSNGTFYTFTVKAINAVGYSLESEPSNAVRPHRHSRRTLEPNETGSEILVNGKTEIAATTIITQVEDKKTTTIIVDSEKVEKLLQQEGNNPVFTISVNNDSNTVVGQLNGQTIKNMEMKEAIIQIKTEDATYTLPASEINIDNISEQIGHEVELKDIVVNIEISESSQNTVKIIEDAANMNSYEILIPPVEFKITCTSGNQTVEVSKFNAYVERMIAIPEGINPSQITTGVVINPDGTFSHVPTTVVLIDGRYYAKINSLTNSAYSVIYSPVEYEDVANHWAVEAVNDMGSRLVINGVEEDRFEPDRDITRAEFATIIVKGLGLMRPGAGKDAFKDVRKDAWYYDAISIAYENGLISGYGDGIFGPNDKTTREQAITIIERAMKVTGLKVDFKDREIEKLFAAFDDSKQSAEWAMNSLAQCVKAGLIAGKSEKTLAPKDSITRAEVAVIIQRLLQKSNLI